MSTESSLRGKLVLVTGSTAGIGKAIAIAFARVGARVVVNGRSEERTREAAADIALQAGSEIVNLTPVAADVSTAEGVDALVRKVAELGQLHVLVCNTGIYDTIDFFDTTDADWDRFLAVNLMSAVRCCRAFMRGMLDADAGRVLIIASEAGMKPLPQMVAYSTTKTALIGLARGLAELTKGTRVTVNSVLAGPTATESLGAYFSNLAAQEGKPKDEVVRDYFRVHEPTSLIQRLVKVEEVAAVVVFLASEAAAAINGASQRVEGGIVRHL